MLAVEFNILSFRHNSNRFIFRIDSQVAITWPSQRINQARTGMIKPIYKVKITNKTLLKLSSLSCISSRNFCAFFSVPLGWVTTIFYSSTRDFFRNHPPKKTVSNAPITDEGSGVIAVQLSL